MRPRASTPHVVTIQKTSKALKARYASSVVLILICAPIGVIFLANEHPLIGIIFFAGALVGLVRGIATQIEMWWEHG